MPKLRRRMASEPFVCGSIAVAGCSQCDWSVADERSPLAQRLHSDCVGNSDLGVGHVSKRAYLGHGDGGRRRVRTALAGLFSGAVDQTQIQGSGGVILFTPRGTLTPNRPLADLTWLRVGGPADYLFQPADEADLCEFLRALDPAIRAFPMGVGSNLIVRDGGMRAVVIRLGRGFNAIEVEGDTVTAGAAALDAHVARKSADAGLDLTFLRTIPGSIGGAVRMNAGCYGSYVADHLLSVRVVTRGGDMVVVPALDLKLRYRQSDLAEGTVIVSATFRARAGDPLKLHEKMDDQIACRDASQPTKERSAGSTFRNPVGYSSTGRADDSHELKAWAVIDAAGLRGAKVGGAQMSEMHSNFMINTGGASATDLEELGELVRKRVFDHSGITLEWEILRVGEKPAIKTI